jgi:pimeloyl-ACP methyl ester carboxylesterase
MKTVTANGLKFGYLEEGPSGGPLALILHGFPDSPHSWRNLLSEMAAAGFHAVAPFMRGYAPTEIPSDGAYQIGALVADANALHEALGGTNEAVIIGHDWGAPTVYGAVAHAPDRWRRAVTMAVPPLQTAFDGGFFGLDYTQLKRSFYMFLFQTPLAEPAVSMNDLAFIDGLWRDWSPGLEAPEEIARTKDCLREPANLTAAINYYRALFDPSVHVAAYAAEQQAAEQGVGKCPVLYLHGTGDECIGADVSAGAEQHLPAGSRIELIEGAGHFLHLERPEEISQKIVDWLSR